MPKQTQFAESRAMLRDGAPAYRAKLAGDRAKPRQDKESAAVARGRSPSEAVKVAPAVDDDFRERLVALIPHLRAFAQTLCHNRDVADDLAQESIMSAWQARRSFRLGTNLRAWLFTIQRNAFYSAYRRKWREAEWNDRAMQRVLITDASQQASVELTDLKRAMTLLPDEQREALILVGAGGFSYKEAASICDCATGTMKSRVWRARHALASLMGEGACLPPSSEDASSAYQAIARELGTLSGRTALARC